MSQKTAKQLREERKAITDQMTALVEAAGKEDRALSAEESEKFDRMDADQGQFLSRIQQLEKIEKLNAEMESPIRIATQLPGRNDVDHREERRDNTKQAATARDRDMAIRGYLMGSLRNASKIEESHREAARRCGVNLHDPNLTVVLHDSTLRAFSQPWRKAEHLLAEFDRLRTTAGTSNQSTSASLGGNTIADSPMQALEIALLQFGGMRETATILRTATGSNLPIPTANNTDEKGAILAENSSAVVEDLAFGQVTLAAHKYSSKMVKVSIELLQDTSIDLTGYIGSELGRRIGRITNQHFTVGTTSSTNPVGMVVASSTGKVTASSTGPTFNEIVDLIHSVDPAYRNMPGTGLMLADATLAKLKKLTDGQGRPIWLPGYTMSEPDRILGYRYVINQDMPTTAGTSTSAGKRRVIAFGDLSKYWIRDVMGIDLLRLDERFAEYGQVAFLAFSRHDGKLVNAGTGPIKHLSVTT